jgi:hypothetical protein
MNKSGIKASVLIASLQQAVKVHGDLQVCYLELLRRRNRTGKKLRSDALLEVGPAELFTVPRL